MSEKRFFTKINKNGRLVIIDKECHTELFDMTLACEVLNRLDLKLKTYNEQLGEQQATINKLQEELDLIANTKLFSRRKLEEENEQLKKKLEILEKIIADVETSVGMDITNLIDNDMCR